MNPSKPNMRLTIITLNYRVMVINITNLPTARYLKENQSHLKNLIDDLKKTKGHQKIKATVNTKDKDNKF